MQRAGNVLARIVKPIVTRYDANRLFNVPRERAGNLLNKFVKPILYRCYDDANHLVTVRGEVSREERDARLKWYFHDVFDVDIYITAALRSFIEKEVYLFMVNEYVLLHYAPGTHDDNLVINGPNLIRKGFWALVGMVFGEWAINCAFGSHHGNEAYIFFGNICAKIDYAPGRNDVKILKATTIARMFPFLKGTAYERGIDAAFESSTMDEAYIFKGGKYARINYSDRDGRLIANNLTFNCLKNTIYERGIDAAFASHKTDEAFLFKGHSFKGDSYLLINFARDLIICGGTKKILPDDWPSLNGIFPRKSSEDDNDDENSDEVGSSEE